jgi:hypothetical protein
MSKQASNVMAMLLTKPVTRIHGRPERDEIDILEKEVAQIVSSAKTTRFTQGRKYGHLVMIIGQNTYRSIIGDATFVFTEPSDEGAYNTVNIVGNVASSTASNASRSQTQTHAKQIFSVGGSQKRSTTTHCWSNQQRTTGRNLQ